MKRALLLLFIFVLNVFSAWAVIPLTGVTGEKIRVRAFFDVNNVKVGDPLILTIDFLGSADFKALHPPMLSRTVDRRDWKLDDTSARTQTESRQVGNLFSSREVDIARRLTYRVRPMREGVLYFPALEFEYKTSTGEKRRVRSNEIPVHARPGADVVVAEMGVDENEMPQPDALVRDPGVALSEDVMFSWRRACANPSPAAFAPFDFPAGRLNEAREAILAGDWSRALSIYARLEWRTGQTPAIEHGIVAALALRYQNPAAELPVWRQVGRPLLRYPWLGRASWVVGSILGAILIFYLLGRLVRVLACVVFPLAFVLSAYAADPFEQIEQFMRQQEQRVQKMMSGSFGGGGFSFGFGGEERKPPKVSAWLELSNPTPRVGERFDFIISISVPKSCTVEPSNFSATRGFGLHFVTGRGESLPDKKSADGSNVVKRIAIPARYDVPFKGRVGFAVSGMITGRQSGGRRNYNYTFSHSFETQTPEVSIEVCSLQDAPVGFAGIVGTGVRLEEQTDGLRVGSNDVMRVNYRLTLNGYLPEDWMPQDVAFECGRTTERSGAVVAEWQRYVVADGKRTTPKLNIVYYDPQTATYKTVSAGASPITYVEMEKP